MRFMLHTPGLQRLVGRSTALLTFTGRKTGTSFTTPITYVAGDRQVILTCHRARRWWRNLADRPAVELRLAGEEISGAARVIRGSEAAPYLIDFWQAQPLLAKRTGATFDAAGRIDSASVEALLVDTVVVVVDIED
jgi:deazaflavin-dependent oxidoreductase (nitroreductase family)